MFEYDLHSIVRMKKVHPCGSFDWEVVRMGADIKMCCTGCGRVVMLSRAKFEKGLKKVLSVPEKDKLETRNGDKDTNQ